MINKSLFSSNSCEWETPQWLFDLLDNEFQFNVDVCASPENAKCKKWYGVQVDNNFIDGLTCRWVGTNWMNPPYGREIKYWVEKAYIESRLYYPVVCLLPARTDTIWWHNYVIKADEIRFLKGRLKFGESNNAAPFPSAIVVFSGSCGLKVSFVDYRSMDV